MELTNKQKQVMAAKHNLLVCGGPGSGKTTISIFKAAQITEHSLKPEQRVLFLSFARATVSRVVEAIEFENKIPTEQKRRIEVETYHSFFWQILKTYGYLIGLPRKLSILTPPNEAIALSGIRSEYPAQSKLSEELKKEKKDREYFELTRLAYEEGQICFDFFAQYVHQIVSRSSRIQELISIKYPTIIFDEFQDTNNDQWLVVKAMGERCRLIVLADPEQRIYDWIGADPERINHFRKAFSHEEVDLGFDNHRSKNTEILDFGNDLLKGHFQKENYKGVSFEIYQSVDNIAWTKLLTTTYKARKRLVDAKKPNWAIAILVPTKKMTRLASDIFRNPPAGLTKIIHSAVVEIEAAILAAEIISYLMQPGGDSGHYKGLIDLLCNFYHGKGGDQPTKTDLSEAQRIQKAYADSIKKEASGKKANKKSIIISLKKVYKRTLKIQFTGNPDRDWVAIRKVLNDGECKRLNLVAKEVRNIRILERGDVLRQKLAQNWRDTGEYTDALEITKQAFVQQHFSTNHKSEQGVVIMNMHKAKGKQFDEVIIFEGWPRRVRGKIVANPDRIVRGNMKENDSDQARQNLRVSITRGKSHTTIITPKEDPCILLLT